MRAAVRVIAAALACVAIAALDAISPPPAAADSYGIDGDYSVNGTFIAFSDGQWAKTNDRFQNEASVTSTWTVTSTCSTPYRCTGKVTSDQGWSADMHMLSGLWYVSRRLDNWQPCSSGGSAPGDQQFRFYRENAATLVGKDKTIGVSGNCGISLPLSIGMPFTLTLKQ
jgi:hypothetical protein